MVQRFVLPWPPSVNTWTRCHRSRAYKSKHWKIYSEGAGAVLGVAGETITTPCRAVYRLEPPTRRKYDLDNRAKIIGDCLQEWGILEDDHLIHWLTLYKGPVFPGGRAIVKVYSS